MVMFPFCLFPTIQPVQPTIAVSDDYSLIEVVLNLEKKVNDLTNVVNSQSTVISELSERVEKLENPENDMEVLFEWLGRKEMIQT